MTDRLERGNTTEAQGDGWVASLSLSPVACPGVFYATLSGDGALARIRTPGGLLIAAQAALVADISHQFAGGIVTITNRANLQLRALARRLPDDILARLQATGLASREPAVDHLRNIMASPAAGLDPDAIIDTRPLVRALDEHLAAHPELAALPAKFSVGLDGGERASIAGLPNDVLFRAYRDTHGQVRVRVVIRVGAGDGAWLDLGVSARPEGVVPLAASIAEAYRSLLPLSPGGSQPRLRHLLAGHDQPSLRRLLLGQVSALAVHDDLDSETRFPDAGATVAAPIGVYPQRDARSVDTSRVGADRVYVGLAPLVAGRLSSAQLRGLADLADTYGSGNLRLTPWRSVLLPDLPAESVERVQQEIEAIGLSSRAPSLASGIVACAGRAGCAAGATDTVHDAQALSRLLSDQTPTSEPLNIHLTGCEKLCAQRQQADITLLGKPGGGQDAHGQYALYVRGPGDARLGRLLQDALSPEDALAEVRRLVASGRPHPPTPSPARRGGDMAGSGFHGNLQG